jgi:phosphoglucosamine mutase
MKKLFGTDGIRGVAGDHPLDPPTIHALGRALVALLREERLPARVLIGRDTRESGGWIEEVLTRGVRAAGGKAFSAGVIPTSGVSYLTRRHAFSAGIVISASHNPFRDNGIKIFSSEGFKIPDAWEIRIEQALPGLTHEVKPKPPADGSTSGYFAHDYRDFLSRRLDGFKPARRLKVVVDAGNGAAAGFAPSILSHLGFDVVKMSVSPNGRNINAACGSLHPQKLAARVVEEGADIGIAYDGDADRALWVDETGRHLNGDHTLYVLAGHMRRTGQLASGTVVSTIMSNMGLEIALERMGLRLLRTKVGDKYVLEKMREIGAELGGEQSGHTILLAECPTGDGILTSLRMLEVLAGCDKPLSALVKGLKEFPQILLNVPVARKADFKDIPSVAAEMARAAKRLARRGRLEVRYSGTEPLARVMVEGEDAHEIHEIAHRIGDAIAEELG